MNKKLVTLLFALFPLLFSVTQVNAQTEPFQATFELNTYAETKIVISYAFTQNVTSIANSAGKSVWRTSEDPYTATFSTTAYDRFVWQINIQYNIVTAQTVTIAVFSGTLPIDTQEYTVKTNKIKFIFTLTVTEQPRPPTAEEYAQASYNLFINQINEWLGEQRTQNDLTRQYIILQWLVVAAFSTTTIVGVIVPMFKRKRGETTE